MIAFSPSGPIQSFTAASTAPTSQQAASVSDVGTQQYCLTNTDATNDATIGWGQTAAEAKANAVAGLANCAQQYWLLRGTQIVVTGPCNAYFTGITGSSTAVVKVQPGYGN